MRSLGVHAVPILENPDGTRQPGMDPHDESQQGLPVVGWCNVAIINFAGQNHRVLLTRRAAD